MNQFLIIYYIREICENMEVYILQKSKKANMLIKEDDYNTFEFRYNNVDIHTYENAKKGDQIVFCGKLHTVFSHSGTNQLLINVNVMMNETGRRHTHTMYLRNVIYCYYNNMMKIPVGAKLYHVNGDQFDLHIDNLRLIREAYGEEFYDWDFRYKYVEGIHIYENAKLGDMVPFGDRMYKVTHGDMKHRRPSIMPSVIIDGKTKVVSLGLHRLVWEYGNHEILITEDIIHHKNHDKYNNRLENLEKMTVNEHVEEHNIERYIPIINLDTGEIFESSQAASDRYNVARTSITNCCSSLSKTAAGFRWMRVDEYENLKCLHMFINSTLKTVENLFNYEFSIEDLSTVNPYEGFEEFTDFK